MGRQTHSAGGGAPDQIAEQPLLLLVGGEQLRVPLDGHDLRSIVDLDRIRHGTRVKVAGLVIARQRPPTAHGITFLLLEDEYGMLNVIVPAHLYDQHKLVIRGEPLILVAGRLERHQKAGGATNLLAENLTRLTNITGAAAPVANLRPPAEPGDTGEDDFRVVAPPAMNFAQGRRR